MALALVVTYIAPTIPAILPGGEQCLERIHTLMRMCERMHARKRSVCVIDKTMCVRHFARR